MSEPRAVLLAAEDVEKDYRSGPEVVHVLRGISMHVNVGEVVALVGASGVGKSTLLHLFGALDRPTRGRVTFAGSDLFARSEAELVQYRRHEVGFVFQFYNLLGEMSALENAMIPSLLARRSVREARERATESLVEVGLADRMRHRPGELSGGEQQRVAIARALVNGPRPPKDQGRTRCLRTAPSAALTGAAGHAAVGAATVRRASDSSPGREPSLRGDACACGALGENPGARTRADSTNRIGSSLHHQRRRTTHERRLLAQL